ncbi:Putative activating signal cointegrator 1 complex subunit 3 B [Gryllus bimaculatus]|nr:Putative activating signal cointegrator 1 complex subunit 3 B [Gryllus bimaculatus]
MASVDTQPAYPRLSRALRAFSTLEPPRKNSKLIEHTLEQRRKWDTTHLKTSNSWPDICKHAMNEMGPKSPALKLMQQLRNLAVEITGGDQSKETVDEAAVFLLSLFLRERIVLHKHQLLLKQMFGNVSLNMANKIHHCVEQISFELSESLVEYIRGGVRTREVQGFVFGEDIKVNPPQRTFEAPDTFFLRDLLIHQTETTDAFKGFSMKYDESAVLAGSAMRDIAFEPDRKYGPKWLEGELQKVSCSLPADVMCQTVLNLLRSGRSNDDLQNELFDLLGFDQFELIQTLFEHRSHITAPDLVTEEKMAISATRSLLESKKPNYCVQVTVQSDREKQMIKQALKEEKRIQRIIAKVENVSDDEGSSPTLVNMNELKVKRQAAAKAMLKPIFSRPRSTQIQEVYPHVYDSQNTAKQAAGFIAGQKMMLPVGVERTDNKMYEEVNIPTSEPAPLSVGNKLVEISSLDEVGQKAFQGMKTLNRIQSVVFDTAYYSNENMLICAPTGAGKTNVAMLTIVNQLRQSMEHGVIQKDSFKIVYIAPMKALAAEMTANFGKRLGPLGISVRELTGDMQLTKTEILQTQMLVTTPEKWDVVTRKGSGAFFYYSDVALTNLVKLLIIDEVHLLHGDRGPVVEALVARTLRQVETTQSMIRIVGLSATLPNYLDVARFLRVNPHAGLFFFDGRFRPVPLSSCFIGIKALNNMVQMTHMDQVCYEKVTKLLKDGHQVMVFVHTRNATARTANVLREMATQKGQLGLFEVESSASLGTARKTVMRAHNKQLCDLFQAGLAIHHAGMLRSDRNLVEKYFSEGLVKVLVCTSTLAWGVNLPAHGVIIRGTEIYDAKHGTYVDLSILDVLQIFGRAGRPQFDKSGHGVIITSHDKLSHYLSLLTNQYPIESNFITCLADNLNAEVALGTVTNVEEAVEWLSYTYLYVRMRINPQVYGINYQDVVNDNTLLRRRRELIEIAAKALDEARMIRFNAKTGDLSITDLGRTASHFYIKYNTVQVFNQSFTDVMTEADVFAMVSQAQEFEQLKVRDDELDELDALTHINCEVKVAGGSENVHGKVNILLQTFLSRGNVNSFSLLSDLSYVQQNSVRIMRALFEVALRRNNAVMSGRFLMLSKMLERRQWDFESPLRQFQCLGHDIIQRLEDSKLSIHKLRDMDAKEIGIFLRHHKMGLQVKKCAYEFPLLEMEASLQPITRTVLRIRLSITANFTWNDRVHGKTSENFWVWVEDPDSNFLYHHEYFLLTRKQVIKREVQELVMTIPLTEPLPSQYYVRATSDRWLGPCTSYPLTFQHLILPEHHPPHTDLLPLEPLPITVLKDPAFESLYNFSHFNPVQTQIFHCLYHTDSNVLLGAPTGSGKTIAAEVAMFRVFKQYPGMKVVYIAPLKALVRERMMDWQERLERRLGRRVVELTGDVTPDAQAIARADVIVTTPEKWDGVSRSWQTRSYVRAVALVVIDEIHLLGEDRGPVLEVIVSRTNYIAAHTERRLRVVGLSTALANARDLANWLDIGEMGLYNFRPSVRPVPLEVHIAGFPGKHYCPRMATMNKPAFQAIRQHSPSQPVLIFVSSRRQTRLTALDLVALLAAEDNPKQWLHLPEQEMEQVVTSVKDSNLKLTLAFGIGLHHAGLQERDRRTVLIATATLAWGVNFPAHLVVVKGTEYYDGKSRRYVDMPITDVLQMMGRAGRPQFDDQGVAVVLVHDAKKNFYKKFLYEPFPVESSLLEVFPDHLCAEIVAGTIRSKQDVLDYLTWTYFFRRLLQNPSYYQLQDVNSHNINAYLSGLTQRSLNTLAEAYCIDFEEDERGVVPTSMGRIASYYYLSHQTMILFRERLASDIGIEELLHVLADVHEYEEMPVRHNEDLLNGDLAKSCPLAVDSFTLDSPHTKTFLLLQAHFSRLELPCADYLTDTKSVLDQALRILQAMLDVVAERGWLATALRVIQVLQMAVQARWVWHSDLLTLPHLEPHHLYIFARQDRKLQHLAGLRHEVCRNYEKLANMLRSQLEEGQIEQLFQVLCDMPVLSVHLSLHTVWDSAESEGDEGAQMENCKLKHGTWTPVVGGREYVLTVQMHRLNRPKASGGGSGCRAHCPKFPRGKDEGWFLVLGNVECFELFALKRVFSLRGGKSSQSLTFKMPTKPGRLILTLYVMSDAYLGLDQQYDLQLEVNSSKSQLEMSDGAYAFPDKGVS